MLTTSTFLDTIEAYLADTKMPASTFGLKAMADPNFVHDLRKGRRSPSLKTVERVSQFMEANRTAEAS